MEAYHLDWLSLLLRWAHLVVGIAWIGKLMLDAQASFQVPIVFAGLLVLAVLGIVLYAMTALVESRFTGWAFRGGANR